MENVMDYCTIELVNKSYIRALHELEDIGCIIDRYDPLLQIIYAVGIPCELKKLDNMKCVEDPLTNEIIYFWKG